MPRLSDTQRAYRAYLTTPAWAMKRRAVVWRAQGMCEACGRRPHSGNPGQVHHDRYPRRWGAEPLDWLRYLCRACHRAWHKANPGMAH
mgnify:CR=1 FL=1